MTLRIQTITKPMSSEALLAIQQLNSRYFHAIDALLDGNNAEIWATTFTPDGTFYLLDAQSNVILQATGTQDLIETYKTFPDVQTTRHWCNNLLIELDGDVATGRCYIIAMSINQLPATIIRSGVYKDQLIKTNKGWKYQSRSLILDPNSPAG